ncbi:MULTISPECIES: hypothetical protein [unclassified Tolypothrix]|uniref:hypothetical protein n=1 Tax=unclassified Tolypothrix TaxID=2649714 RepID=UPI0005EAB258|nr:MULTISPECIES: hypothetical protein [unclassified Tolypothrix]BAY91214.1 hypothetical protein NIES3275_32370 [Microchaete diplosiphon NIES-3275]EKF00005.1 hypothetical protein FDUTEX481_09373 [Tolypothrix sp. PCC 7601]MBE9080859.1 hypothetical protein [Tolypothrix sp. LEGE 11397]UYD25296.1 hypothetical protein HGR01_28570 [Tolypothrix sp. PCC 7712]UYD32464.1 hypothetical protein HG267_26030 [Tolypothrix sp. PCC 7601]
MNQLTSTIKKILYIGTRSPDINIDDEVKAIQYIMDAENSKFFVDNRTVDSTGDVDRAIQRAGNSAQIIHISGHGTGGGKIKIVEKDPKIAEELEPRTLAEYIKNAGDVDCVILNFCYSKEAANFIAKNAKNVKRVIGINDDIDSPSAVEFSTAFYRELCDKPLNSSVVDKAFLEGRAAASQINRDHKYIRLPKVVSISCLGDVNGSRFLNGRTREGTVALAPSIEARFSGTRWEMDEIPSNGDSTVVTLKCLGDVDGYRFLDGRTREGTVALVMDIEDWLTGTKWQILPSNGDSTVVTLKCLGDVDGYRFLDGRTREGTVGLMEKADGLNAQWRIDDI